MTDLQIPLCGLKGVNVCSIHGNGRFQMKYFPNIKKLHVCNEFNCARCVLKQTSCCPWLRSERRSVWKYEMRLEKIEWSNVAFSSLVFIRIDLGFCMFGVPKGEKTFPNLKTLTLLNGDTHKERMTILSVFSRCTTITTLVLKGFGWEEFSLNENKLEFCKGVHTLKWNNRQFSTWDMNFRNWVNVLSFFPSLTELHLTNMNEHSMGLRLDECIHTLEILHLEKVILALGKVTSLPKLRELYMRNSTVASYITPHGTHTFPAYGLTMERLERLKIIDTKRTGFQAIKFARGGLPSLKWHQLTGCVKTTSLLDNI